MKAIFLGGIKFLIDLKKELSQNGVSTNILSVLNEDTIIKLPGKVHFVLSNTFLNDEALKKVLSENGQVELVTLLFFHLVLKAK